MAVKKRVVVGMSGGVDSSVAAALLKEQGYEVIGVYILGWTGTKEFPCSWQKEEQDARKVAEMLNIPFYTMNLSKEYEEAVVQSFFESYRNGETPNPDILCNSEVKFKALWRELRQFEPDYFATGHYARISEGKIYKARDLSKDQSYFLWNIEREMLSKILFPLGELTKTEVRTIAQSQKLPTATKKDSQGICFIGPLKVRQFLRSVLRPLPGKAYLRDGRLIAEHEGAALYTIGQRLGANSVNWTGDVPPLFVLAKDVPGNRLIIGQDKDLYSSSLIADSANLLNGKLPEQCKAKLRYRQEDVGANISQSTSDIQVSLDQAVRAITPGQSMVMYKDDGQLLGGAIIRRVPAVEQALTSVSK